MTLQPTLPQSPARVAWELEVKRELAARLECTEQEAQDILEVHVATLGKLFSGSAAPHFAAECIDHASGRQA